MGRGLAKAQATAEVTVPATPGPEPGAWRAAGPGWRSVEPVDHGREELFGSVAAPDQVAMAVVFDVAIGPSKHIRICRHSPRH